MFQKSPPARFSVRTSPSHPALTPSNANEALTGVGRMSQLDCGLLAELEADDSGGVEGMSQSVLSDSMAALSSIRTGFCTVGCGDCAGVSICCCW
jgi:hypothetical protein